VGIPSAYLIRYVDIDDGDDDSGGNDDDYGDDDADGGVSTRASSYGHENTTINVTLGFFL
jgi:hypothetical protein